MLNEIYNKRIIELAGNIPRLGRLAAPDASATARDNAARLMTASQIEQAQAFSAAWKPKTGQ